MEKYKDQDRAEIIQSLMDRLDRVEKILMENGVELKEEKAEAESGSAASDSQS